MEPLNLTVDEVLTTTRNVRKRLDLTRPVDRSIVQECIEIALQAPTGSNNQSWEWIAVDDPETKAELARLQREGLDAFRADAAFGPARESGAALNRNKRAEQMSESVSYLIERMEQVPVLVLPWIRTHRRVEGLPTFYLASYYGSILQAVWSMMLALRARGLGSTWTTLLLWKEREVADLLGLDYEHYTLAGMFPVAYTKGTDFKPAQRASVTEVLHWNAMTPKRS